MKACIIFVLALTCAAVTRTEAWGYVDPFDEATDAYGCVQALLYVKPYLGGLTCELANLFFRCQLRVFSFGGHPTLEEAEAIAGNVLEVFEGYNCTLDVQGILDEFSYLTGSTAEPPTTEPPTTEPPTTEPPTTEPTTTEPPTTEPPTTEPPTTQPRTTEPTTTEPPTTEPPTTEPTTTEPPTTEPTTTEPPTTEPPTTEPTTSEPPTTEPPTTTTSTPPTFDCIDIRGLVNGCVVRDDGDYMVCQGCRGGIFVTCSNGLQYVRRCAPNTGQGPPLRFDPALGRCEYETPFCP